MAVTTNYNWTTPDDVDLVKDGAAAIRTLGSSADTTVKALNPGTTAGDIDYYTAATTKARVGIGTAGQVLAVNSGATAPEWVTSASGGMTLLETLNLAGVSTATTASLSSSYKQFFIFITGAYSASASYMRLRINGDTGTEYGYNNVIGGVSSVTTANSIGNTGLEFNALTTNSTARVKCRAFLTIMKPSSTELFMIAAQGFNYDGAVINWQTVGSYTGGAAITTLTIYSGVNFTAGTAEVYGVN